jgi:hypothetical protein
MRTTAAHQTGGFMEPLEWLVLGIGLLVGGLVGSKGKGMVKSAAKGYLVVGEKARVFTSNLREDFRDAIEEARYEQEQEDAIRESAEYDTEVAHETAANKTKPRKSTAKASQEATEHA